MTAIRPLGEKNMIDIEAINASDDEDKLKELKSFLFKENIRLKEEQKEIEEAKNKLTKEREQFQLEMDMLSRRISMEQKRLKDDNLFFDKKFQILQDAYRQLEIDRNQLEKQKTRFQLEKELWDGEQSSAEMMDVVSVLFRGVSNPLALRKRYKDLLKIFHPDNLCGDAELVQMINREYERRKKAE